MTYCRNCGSKLDDDARFCRVCGAPVAQVAPPQQAPPARQIRRRSVFPAVILIAVLVIAAFAAVFVFVPFRPVNFSQSYSAASVSGIDYDIKLDFTADVADVNIIPADLDGELVRLDVSAVGSTGIFGSAESPVQVNFSNQTNGSVMTVTARVSRDQVWPLSYNIRVACNLLVDRTVAMDLNVQTTVGEISLEQVFWRVTYNGLNLQSTTGSIDAWLQSGMVAGDVSVTSTTGGINLRWNNVEITGDTRLDVASTTGAVRVLVSETADLGGDLTLETSTTTGSIQCEVTTRGNLGFQITSQTSTGSISADGLNINGDTSHIYSDNYPGENNIIVNLASTTGSITVEGNYNPDTIETVDVRDDVVNYIVANHPDMLAFAPQQWQGGREETGGLGAEKYVYSTLTGHLGSAGLAVTLEYPVVPNPTYTVTANYSNSGVLAPYEIVWRGTWQNGVVTETSYNSTLPSTQEQARDDVMVYIRDNHEDAATLLQDLSYGINLNWTGGRVQLGGVGAEKYVYTTIPQGQIVGAAGWTVTMTYPVVPNPVYAVTVNYTQSGVLNPYRVVWEGTWQDSAVAETSYSSNVPTLQEQIRNAVMTYLSNSHEETSQFMANLNWTGGRVETGLDGASVYTYISGGWNVTMAAPVVPDPIYTVTADYKAPETGIPYRVIWDGTWQDNVITETDYEFAQ